MRSAVRIILEALDDARDSVLVALEIDQAVALLVAAADMARGLPAGVIARSGAIFFVVREASGPPLCRCERSILTTKRVPGEVGFILMSAMAYGP